ncbi:hydrogenase iron-sulfur subunit [Candidatus Korarchaeum cryptofilum]|uniref:Coenzyme F420-reducing hydrogenase, delta subunit n=1 Tax=Korarchaeum cryptofilum (strain OPF8) TaxID=374847 RepID=B1L5Y4_KORCO|nr:hydrogenase iron-sulfur subunit [Candidatus Korarchaeum cryptofilum]ACB07863.1 Coenzyme F420-reducing hydrogenase, delta subunit [Candidatus Korarchaeum cryptofilum OPF8]
MSGEFEPKIVVIACHWCTYQAINLAGTSRMKYPPNVRTIRVMCSGRTDPQFVIEAFRNGADGVLVAGCHPGDCHYVNGNMKTMRRTVLLEKMLEQMGIEKGRFRREWISAAEAKKWVDVVTEMVDQIKKLGPLKLAGRGDE